jgi:hypothetical protein
VILCGGGGGLQIKVPLTGILRRMINLGFIDFPGWAVEFFTPKASKGFLFGVCEARLVLVLPPCGQRGSDQTAEFRLEETAS